MTNTTSLRTPRIALGALVIAAVTAAAPHSFARQPAVQRASDRRVMATLKCVAHARRHGADESACIAGAEDRLHSCMGVVLTEIPDGGRCSARKLAAARRRFKAIARGDRDAEAQSVLCRAFDHAGACEGDCAAVEAALHGCVQRVDPPGALPAPDAADTVVAFGAYEGDALSTVSIVGQDDVTDTARVVVEHGTSPLYVVLSAYESIIWRFEGDTSRVAQVVLLGPDRQAVTGIAPRLVYDASADSAQIGWWDDPTSAEAIAARPAIEDAVDRPIDAFAGAYTVGTLRVPSMEVEVATPSSAVPAGFDLWTWTLGTFFNPGGLVDVDLAAVVPSDIAEPYQVYPQEFGLSQLVGQGLLEARDEYFYIGQPIPRFPAGLYGAHLASFVLGSGVPMPPGDPGHSCVISEETGQPVDGTLCFDVPPPPGECAMPPALPDDEVVVFGAYEGDAAATATLAGQDEITRTARVVIEPGSRPLYVVLSGFDSIIWRFEGATERVRELVLTGVRAQGVTGIAPDRVSDWSQSVDSLPESRCFAPFWDAQSPDGVAARGAVSRILARPVDVFAASYAFGRVSLPSADAEPSPSPAAVPAGFDPAVYQLALWFNPGGLMDVDPAAVVPAGVAESYVVYPEAFGLAQLTGSGALQLRGEAMPVEGTFYIAQPIARFPAGLYGSESVSFILGTGVPMPPGSPGHSCVISEETGLPVANDSLCSLFGR